MHDSEMNYIPKLYFLGNDETPCLLSLELEIAFVFYGMGMSEALRYTV